MGEEKKYIFAVCLRQGFIGVETIMLYIEKVGFGMVGSLPLV